MGKYVVYDLEMCKVPKGDARDAFGAPRELIQIGAVKLDEDLNEIDTFMTYVKPRFGFIDEFIERLTGIKQTDVECAPSTEEAIEAFLSWIPEDAQLVSWSESDIYQLYKEIDGKGIDSPRLEELLEDSFDCQREFEDRINARRSYGLADALMITGIDCDEEIHNGLVDAKNTALLFAKLQKEPTLKMSEYYLTEDDMRGYMSSSKLK